MGESDEFCKPYKVSVLPSGFAISHFFGACTLQPGLFRDASEETQGWRCCSEVFQNCLFVSWRHQWLGNAPCLLWAIFDPNPALQAQQRNSENAEALRTETRCCRPWQPAVGGPGILRTVSQHDLSMEVQDRTFQLAQATPVGLPEIPDEDMTGVKVCGVVDDPGRII